MSTASVGATPSTVIPEGITSCSPKMWKRGSTPALTAMVPPSTSPARSVSAPLTLLGVSACSVDRVRTPQAKWINVMELNKRREMMGPCYSM